MIFTRGDARSVLTFIDLAEHWSGLLAAGGTTAGKKRLDRAAGRGMNCWEFVLRIPPAHQRKFRSGEFLQGPFIP